MKKRARELKIDRWLPIAKLHLSIGRSHKIVKIFEITSQITPSPFKKNTVKIVFVFAPALDFHRWMRQASRPYALIRVFLTLCCPCVSQISAFMPLPRGTPEPTFAGSLTFS